MKYTLTAAAFPNLSFHNNDEIMVFKGTQTTQRDGPFVQLSFPQSRIFRGIHTVWRTQKDRPYVHLCAPGKWSAKKAKERFG